MAVFYCHYLTVIDRVCQRLVVFPWCTFHGDRVPRAPQPNGISASLPALLVDSSASGAAREVRSRRPLSDGPRLPSTRWCVPLPIILSMRCDGVLEALMGRLHRCLLRVHSALPAVPLRLSLRVTVSTSSFAGVGPLRRSAPSPSKVMPVTSSNLPEDQIDDPAEGDRDETDA